MGLKQTKLFVKENNVKKTAFTENGDKSSDDWIQGDSFLLSKSSEDIIFGVSKNEEFLLHCKYQPTLHSKMGNTYASSTEVRNVVEMIRNGEKILVIMRGLPGSGKSTLAHHLIKSSLGAIKEKVIFSADDSFIDPCTKEYKFNRRLLHRAHSQNIRKVLNAAKQNVTPLIIDNTNLELSEMLPYASIAAKYNYTVKFLEPCTPWRYNRRECAKRNVHGVREDHIFIMMKRFDRSLTEADLFSFPSKISFVNHRQNKKRIEHKTELECHCNRMSLLNYTAGRRLIFPHFSSFNELRTLIEEFFVILHKIYTSKHSDAANSIMFHKEEEHILKNIRFLQEYNKNKQNFRNLEQNKDAWLKANEVVIPHSTRTISFSEFFKFVYAIYCILHDNTENSRSVISQSSLTVFSEQASLRKYFLLLLVIIGSRTRDTGVRTEEEDKCEYKLNLRNNYPIAFGDTKNIEHSGHNISTSACCHAMKNSLLSVSIDNTGEEGNEEDGERIRSEKHTNIHSSESHKAKNIAAVDGNYLLNTMKGDNGKPDMWDVGDGVSWVVEETVTPEVGLYQADCLLPKPPRPNRKPRVSQYSWEIYSPELLLPKPPRPNRKPRVAQYSWEEYAPELEVKSGALTQELEMWGIVEDPLSSWGSKQTREYRSDTGRRLLTEEPIFPIPACTADMDIVLESNGSLHCKGRQMYEAVSKPQRPRRNRHY